MAKRKRQANEGKSKPRGKRPQTKTPREPDPVAEVRSLLDSLASPDSERASIPGVWQKPLAN